MKLCLNIRLCLLSFPNFLMIVIQFVIPILLYFLIFQFSVMTCLPHVLKMIVCMKTYKHKLRKKKLKHKELASYSDTMSPNIVLVFPQIAKSSCECRLLLLLLLKFTVIPQSREISILFLPYNLFIQVNKALCFFLVEIATREISWAG